MITSITALGGGKNNTVLNITILNRIIDPCHDDGFRRGPIGCPETDLVCVHLTFVGIGTADRNTHYGIRLGIEHYAELCADAVFGRDQARGRGHDNTGICVVELTTRQQKRQQQICPPISRFESALHGNNTAFFEALQRLSINVAQLKTIAPQPYFECVTA